MSNPDEEHWLTRPASIRKLWWGFSAVLALTLVLAAPSASALTIVRNFGGGLAPTTNFAGGGNLVNIFNAAADACVRSALPTVSRPR